MPKTLFLFQEDFMSPKFFELDGDYSHLHKTYINGGPESINTEGLEEAEAEQVRFQYECKVEELNSLVYLDMGGHKVKFLEPNQPTKDWDYYVECGFIP